MRVYFFSLLLLVTQLTQTFNQNLAPCPSLTLQSYKESGYPSVGILEPRGYTGDPQYHQIGDVVNRPEYSTMQLMLTARVALAAASVLAELEEPTAPKSA